MDEGPTSLEAKCPSTKRKTNPIKTAKMIIVDLDDHDTSNKEHSNFSDNEEKFNKETLVEDCLSEPISTNSFTSPSLLEGFPKEILHMESEKAKTSFLTSEESKNSSSEPEKRRTRRKWQLKKIEKQPKRTRPLSSSCYSSDRTRRELRTQLIDNKGISWNIPTEQNDLISIIKGPSEPLQDESKPKSQLQRSRTWTIIRRSKSFTMDSDKDKKIINGEEIEHDKIDITCDKDSQCADNECDASIPGDKTPTRRQWEKPLVAPDFMVKRCFESNEDESYQTDKEDTLNLISLNIKNPALSSTPSNYHSSVLPVLSTCSLQAVAKPESNSLTTSIHFQSAIKPTNPFDVEEDSEENWKSYHENSETFDIRGIKCSEKLSNKDYDVKQFIDEESLVNDLQNTNDIEDPNSKMLDKSQSHSRRVDFFGVEKVISLGMEKGNRNEHFSIGNSFIEESVNENQMVSEMKEIFQLEGQVETERSKTRTKKLAWPLEALDDALGSLKKRDSVEKNAAMQTIGRLALFYPEIAEAKQLILVKGLASEIRDCRPYISRLAIVCVLSLFSRLNFSMVQCFIEIYDALLSSLKSAENEYVKHDVLQALDHLTGLAYPQLVIQALLLLLERYENMKEKQMISHLLVLAVKREDSISLLQTHLPLSELLLNAAAQFSEDSDGTTRANGQKIINHFDSNPTFKTLLPSLMSEGTIQTITPLLQAGV